MSAWVEVRRFAVVAILGAVVAAAAAEGPYGLGTPIDAATLAPWDIDVRPDGQGLPEGSGTVEDGEALYAERCASCHGEFGEAFGRYPALIGGADTLASGTPVKSVGSYWPYATTLFDYIRRAMPFGYAQSLSADETYALAAFILWSNEIVDDDFVADRASLPLVEMPNRDGFIADARPDAQPHSESPCVENCPAKTEIVNRARQVDVTPEVVTHAAGDVADSAAGERQFAACGACHSLQPGEHRVGPSLSDVFGRAAGATDFPRYSAALKASGWKWDEATLDAFLVDPMNRLPGTIMAFPGVRDADARRDIIAYLKQQFGR